MPDPVSVLQIADRGDISNAKKARELLARAILSDQGDKEFDSEDPLDPQSELVKDLYYEHLDRFGKPPYPLNTDEVESSP